MYNGIYTCTTGISTCHHGPVEEIRYIKKNWQPNTHMTLLQLK